MAGGAETIRPCFHLVISGCVMILKLGSFLPLFLNLTSAFISRNSYLILTRARHGSIRRKADRRQIPGRPIRISGDFSIPGSVTPDAHACSRAFLQGTHNENPSEGKFCAR